MKPEDNSIRCQVLCMKLKNPQTLIYAEEEIKSQLFYLGDTI